MSASVLIVLYIANICNRYICNKMAAKVGLKKKAVICRLIDIRYGD